MTEMTHDDAAAELAAYANDSLPAARRDAVARHLRSCYQCAADLDAWHRIAAAVRADAAVSDLPADRALAAVWAALDTPAAGDTGSREEAAADDKVRRLDPRRRRRWPRLLATRVAAAAVLLLVVMAVLPREGDDNEQLLLTAATRTAEAGAALIDLQGTGALAVGADTAEQAADAFTVTADINGDGAVAFDRRLRTRVTVAAADPAHADLADPRRIETVTIGADRYTREDGGAWTRDTNQPRLLGAALLSPDTPTLLLQSADGPIEDLGADTIDGQRDHPAGVRRRRRRAAEPRRRGPAGARAGVDRRRRAAAPVPHPRPRTRHPAAAVVPEADPDRPPTRLRRPRAHRPAPTRRRRRRLVTCHPHPPPSDRSRSTRGDPPPLSGAAPPTIATCGPVHNQAVEVAALMPGRAHTADKESPPA